MTEVPEVRVQRLATRDGQKDGAQHHEAAPNILGEEVHSADPKMPSAIMRRRGDSPRARRLPLTSAMRASTPPSPLLSARMITMWYLIVTTITRDQNTSESTPSTLPGVTGMPCVPENE